MTALHRAGSHSTSNSPAAIPADSFAQQPQKAASPCKPNELLKNANLAAIVNDGSSKPNAVSLLDTIEPCNGHLVPLKALAEVAAARLKLVNVWIVCVGAKDADKASK